MGTQLLVSLDISAGDKVLDALEADGISVDVLMWAVLEEYQDWRLLLYSSSFRDDDRTDAYARMTFAVHDEFTFAAPTITILRERDPFVKELRSLFGSAATTYGMRLGGQSIGGRYIEDAFVYRIR